jgi:nucleotide-binding universal stress UspA family protein
MYRRVLISIDDSDSSQAALEHGIKLAHDQQADVRIIHIIDTQSLYTYEGIDIGSILAAWRRVGQAVLDHAVVQAQQAGAAVVSSTLLETEGRRIPSVIVAEAERWSADLIVLGTHGRHGIDRLLMGSVAEGVVRTAPVPVLLIRK